jgi:signal transduction histidine kinase
MKLRSRITVKLFIWYFALVTIFYGTMVVLFIHIQQIMKISEGVVSRNFKISSASRKMVESLLWMAENESKYNVLKKEEYKYYFSGAQREFIANLSEILRIESSQDREKSPWKEIFRDYVAQLPGGLEGPEDSEEPGDSWIPEQVINDWIRRISKARAENEQEIELGMRTLNFRGQMAEGWGFLGLGLSVLLALAGSIFLTRSINRPLRELRKGIRSISTQGVGEPVRVLSKDEFGELAAAFNDMSVRLREEERMRSDFISMLSHEIRTPLTSIRESVNLIVEEVMGPINAKQQRFLDIASKEIERITGLLNHLLQVSRLEAGALKVQPRPLNPASFVLGSIYRVTPAAEAKGISIRADLPENMPEIMGDPENLQQVLLNLIGNAIKFSPPGSEVVVRVDAETPESAGGMVFSVSDKGPGIPEEEFSMVFHKYYRASGVRHEVDGVGLGLSISKYIVEAHGGSVWVRSQEGQGSTFGFTLPLLPKEES